MQRFTELHFDESEVLWFRCTIVLKFWVIATINCLYITRQSRGKGQDLGSDAAMVKPITTSVMLKDTSTKSLEKAGDQTNNLLITRY